MNTNQLVLDLKENQRDFEFYPTTDEILKIICTQINEFGNILDIGEGNGTFKRYLDRNNIYYSKYFAIEKSEILINQLDKDTYILGTDFHQCTLIDKPVDTIFCNPPYSEFKEWTLRIIKEGNFNHAFLVIPERWQNDKEIEKALEFNHTFAKVIAQRDFLTADRQARAKVHIVKLEKTAKKEFVFDNWFKETFGFEEVKDHNFEFSSEKQDKIKNEIVSAPNKIEYLVNLYTEEMNRLYSSFKAICQLDVETLHDIGVESSKVKESLKYKIEHTKIFYWHLIFDFLDDITKRLTYKTREKLFNEFERLNTVDFNASNIRAVVIWVLKNASSLFDEQLIDFYKELTTPDNIIKYKSNQRVFKRDSWYNSRFDRGEMPTHYCLSYRMIATHYNVGCGTYVFDKNDKMKYDTKFEQHKARAVIDDLCAIANNLGFEIACKEIPNDFGKNRHVTLNNGKTLIEYKFYKNGNTHFKLNIEFAKALNVEVARLLGWIRDKSEVATEFPDDMKDAAKYYGANFRFSIEKPNIKLLGR